MQSSGLDSDGREFENSEEMWREEVGDQNKKSEWYRQGVSYWQRVEASVDGVLGGYGHVNDVDIKESEEFLNSVLAERFRDAGRGQNLVALDCGSGIGRVTKNLLIRYFHEVDLLEPVSHFLDAARVNLSPENLIVSDSHKAANFYCLPLQDFTPETERYNCIWIQWCIGHLADDDLVAFFKRAKAGLKPGGFFVLKENIARTGFVLDKEDKSVTRSDSYFMELFNQSGLHIYKMKNQKDFPKELFSVKLYALTTELPRRVGSRTKRSTNRPGIIKCDGLPSRKANPTTNNIGETSTGSPKNTQAPPAKNVGETSTSTQKMLVDNVQDLCKVVEHCAILSAERNVEFKISSDSVHIYSRKQ